MPPDPPRSTLDFAGRDIPIEEGDSVLDALMRAGTRPTAGGVLCAAGDCASCLAIVDGVAYTRTCQTAARTGQVVTPHPPGGAPQLPTMPSGRVVDARNVFCDVAVVGASPEGRTAAEEARAAGAEVVLLDAGDGVEVVGIYAGPKLVARSAGAILHVHPERIVIATGSREIPPVCEGAGVDGVYSAAAARRWVDRGVELGELVVVGDAPVDAPGRRVDGGLVRIEGDERVTAVVVRTETGEVRHACDGVVVGLGRSPRDDLARMATGLPVEVVGSAGMSSDLPPCPETGTVCPCSGVTVADLDAVFARGFTEMELLKRATLAGTGTCQGAQCVPHLRSYLAAHGGDLQPAFTARPVARQLTMGEAAAGMHHPAVPRTALDAVHRERGARMDRIGRWWRPWTYGDTDGEVAAVRSAVSLGDVSTLGKMRVQGPDALELLERLYPTRVATIRPGRMRYVLMLDERGYVMDDGLIACVGPNRYLLTFTTGGAGHAEMWVRDWASGWGLDVRILNETMSAAAINVTGPRARDLLARAGLQAPPGWMEHAAADVAGVPCHVFRLSFTGEISYELHHPVDRSVELWHALEAAGADLGVRPHGIEALLRLRLEKGHVIVGQDTDYDSTPRRLGMGWAVAMDKGDFVGRGALLRTDALPLDKRLVGLTCAGSPPLEGASIWHGDGYVGYVTSACWSPPLGQSVMLGWVDLVEGAVPVGLSVDDRDVAVTPTPFYDPEGRRARA